MRVTVCCCRKSLSTETTKRRRGDLELDTASSERVPPPLADDNDRRGSRVGSVGATFLLPSRMDRGVSSPDLAG